MFDTAEEYIADELLTNINEIKSGNLTVITANNIKRKCRLYEGGFDLNDDDDSFGKPGFEKAIRRIQQPKGPLSKLFKSKIQYEIYDWNTYKCIIR